ncbi:hypothetical protein LINPERPRIM_LOCUS36425 [Linum perenne]
MALVNPPPTHQFQASTSSSQSSKRSNTRLSSFHPSVNSSSTASLKP